MIASNPPILIVFALAFAAYANRRPLTTPRSSFLPAELAAVHAATGDGMQRFAKLSTCFRFPVISRLSCFASSEWLVLRNDPRFQKLAGL